MRIQITTDVVAMSDYRFLLTGGTSLEDPPPKPADWVPDRFWSELFKLSKISDKYLPLLSTFTREVSTEAVLGQARLVGQATRPKHGSYHLRFSFETDIQSIAIELRLCQTIKNKVLDTSLKRLPKMNLQIFI